MSDIDVTKEIESILQQLHDDGKEPTTALVRARLKTSVPIPVIVAAIKSWKSSKRVPKVAVRQSALPNVEKRVIALEDELSQLKQKLAYLESIIEKPSQ